MRKNVWKLVMRVGPLLFMLPLLTAMNVGAASFDCAKAMTKVEKMICADAGLSKLDEALNKVYIEALKKSSDPAGLKDRQRKWLKERNHCADAGCLQAKYQQHLVFLNQDEPVYATIYPDDISEFEVDCNKANSIAEKLICKQTGSPVEQERIIDYHKKQILPDLQWALMRSQDKQKVLESQRQWQREVRDACTDVGCCGKAYFERRMELRALWERPGSCYTLKPLSYDKGDYETVRVDEKGKVPPIEPVCQAMEENLNHFCDQPPMVCDLKVAPRFQGRITFPEWVPLDPEANLASIEEFIRAPWEDSIVKGAPQRRWEEDRPQVEAALAAKRLTFSKAQLDLYNLGKAQLAYRLDFGTCKAENPQLANGPTQWREPITSAQVKTQQAPEVIRLLLQEYISLDDGTASETFLYGGQTYTYWMIEGWDGKNFLYVNRHEQWTIPLEPKVNLSMHNLCKFDYQPIKEEEK